MADGLESRAATNVRFRILAEGEGFVIETDGQRGDVAYVTKEAAWQAVAVNADRALAEGKGLEIVIGPGPGAIA